MSTANTSGREPIVYVEMDQDFCGRTYGVAPCNAQVGVTGARRCFNTLATCQWRSAWQRTIKSLRFTNVQPAPDPLAIPSVVSVNTAPTVINPGGKGSRSGPLGQRASVTVTFQDHPDTDAQTDPYYAIYGGANAATWRDRGTFWSKWLARNPYHVNRVIRIRTGYIGQDIAEFVSRTYLIERIDGPDSSGKVTLRAKDILRLADDDKAVAPKPSLGTLIEDFPAEAAPAYLRVAGASSGDYPALSYVRVGREVLFVSSVTIIGGSEIRLNVTRAQEGTEAQSHRAGDRVQLCLRYSNFPVYGAVYQLLTTYAGVSAAYIDVAAWLAENTQWLGSLNVTTLITEPTGVTRLLGEIAEQCQFLVWWDERAQRIRFEALKPLDGQPVAQFNDEQHVIADSVRIRTDPRRRASQVWVFYGVADPTERVDTDTNYRSLHVRADLDAESPDEYGEPAIYKIHSRWLATEGQAINIATRILNRLRNPTRAVTVDVDAKDQGVWTGDVLDLRHRAIVDFNGNPSTLRYQVLSAEDVEPGHRIRYELEAYEFALGVRSAFWMADSAPPYSSASTDEKSRGAWWASSDGTIPGGDPGYNWI